MNTKEHTVKKVVTRFAPSPTGFLHVGTARTAIFAWAYARKHSGTFILRIEDTDKAREVVGATEHIIKSLSWLGIEWDEGPDIGGSHGPYIQSQRLDTYIQYAHKLIEKGLAYPCPYSSEEIDSFRKKAEDEKRPFLIREHRPSNFNTWDGTQPLRLKIPILKKYQWHDLARGVLSAGEESLDDIVLIKSDGYPTYNFAHIIDDLMMGVTHIIRGQEFISSMPNYLALYEALEIIPPYFATMPEILSNDGKKKLSKRDGAKDILSYRSEGYLPETMFNFLGLLGWHPEEGSEVLSTQEFISLFSLERVQKAGAKLDEAKLRWLNRQKILQLTDDVFFTSLTQHALHEGLSLPVYTKIASPDIQTRCDTLTDACVKLQNGEYSYLETEIQEPTTEMLLLNSKAGALVVKENLIKTKELISKFNTHHTGEVLPADIETLLMPFADRAGRAAVLWPLRIALTSKEKSSDPFTIITQLANLHSFSIVEKRIATAINLL